MSFAMNFTRESLKAMLTEAYRQNPIGILDIMTEVIRESCHRDQQERQGQQEQTTPSSRTLGSVDTWSPEDNYQGLDQAINENLTNNSSNDTAEENNDLGYVHFINF